MRKTLSFALLALALAGAQLPAAAQEPAAARVLALAGSASVERAGVLLPLQTGSTLQAGDLVDVADRSVLQLRFSDEAVIALRAGSRLKIGEHRYSAGADDSTLLELVRGGMRTLTGLLAKANPRAFQVRTATSTIGIRGTHFTLVACNGDCVNPDGSRPADGLFGGVADGRIAVTNQAGEEEFGQQEYFYVASAAAAPQRLLAPPAVLNERQFVTRARAAAAVARAGQAALLARAAQAGTFAARAGSVDASTSPQLLAQRLPQAVTQALREAIATGERPAIVEALTSSTQSITLVNVRSSSGTLAVETGARSVPPAQLREALSDFADLSFYNSASLALQLARTRAVTVEARPAAGAYWTYLPASDANPLGHHIAWGDTPAALPTSGVAVYNFVGGTTPTDNFGRTGELSAGRLGMDFAGRQVKALDNITLKFAAQSNTLPGVGYVIPASTAWNMAGGAQAVQVQCVGCVGTPVGAVNGGLVGASLEGYVTGIGVQSQIGSGGAAARHTAGAVAAFGRQ